MANLGPNLSQRLSQSQTLALTPAMQLKLKLWQMNLLELSQTIERELGENPLLELQEDGDEVPTLEALEEGRDSEVVDSAPAADGVELPEGVDSVDLGPLADGAGEDGGDAAREALSREEGISQVQETEIGAENSWDTDIPRTSNLPEDGERTSWEDRLSSSETLQEHLLGQLYQTMDPDDPRAPLMESLIDHVDPKGFLRVDPDLGGESTPDELARELGITEPALRELLEILQEFDPSGVGCFSVQESLLLQLRHAGAEPDDLAVRIIQDHCDLLIQRDNVKLRKAIGCSEEDLGEALAILRHLHPAPGRAFDPESERVVKPDVVVLKGEDDSWKVYLNDETVPRLRCERRVPALPGRGRGQGRQGLHPREIPFGQGFHPRGRGPQPHGPAGRRRHRRPADGIHETWHRVFAPHGAAGCGGSHRFPRINHLPGGEIQDHPHPPGAVRPQLLFSVPAWDPTGETTSPRRWSNIESRLWCRPRTLRSRFPMRPSRNCWTGTAFKSPGGRSTSTVKS